MKLNLEPIFYNLDGSYKPIGRADGTTDERLKSIRNTFMENEKEFFLELLNDPEECKVLARYASGKTTDELFEEAINIMHKLEYDNLETHEEKEMMKKMTKEERIRFHREKVYNAEASICFLFAHAGDKIIRKSLYLFAKKPDEENYHLYSDTIEYHLVSDEILKREREEREKMKKKVL